VLRTKLKLSASLRGQAKFDKAASLVEELLVQHPRYLEPLVEKGMLLEARAEAGQGDWPAAFGYWQDLAQRLARLRPRPLSCYDAWYHAAWALYKQKQAVKARQILAGVMRLNPGVGDPEMKARYEELLGKVK
jgi:cellulose synthase operon protein C